MKKIIIILLITAMSGNIFSQKKELKIVEKFIKSEDFNSAIKNLELISNSIESSENKIKAKYYYLKGLSLYQNGESDFDMQNNAIKQFKISKSLNVGDISEKSVKILQSIFNNYIEKYNSLYDNKNFTDSYKHIESAYRIYEKDTFYLYNAAIVANQAKLFKESLQHYLELVDMGYTGISMGYYATEKESGKESMFNDKKSRDLVVKFGTHDNPRDIKYQSQEVNILRQISAIYKRNEDFDNSLKYLDNALDVNENDVNEILDKASLYWTMGNIQEYEVSISKVLEIDPNNYELLCNLAILNKEKGNYEEAAKFINRAIQIDDKNIRGITIAGEILLQPADEILDEMNSLGNSRSDYKKYDELNEKRELVMLEAVTFFEKAFQIDNENQFVITTLYKLYSNLGNEEKYEFYKNLVK